MDDVLERWRDPVFNGHHTQVPAGLASRLTEMAGEVEGRQLYYERMHVLLAVAGVARNADPGGFPLKGPPRTNWLERL